MYKIRKTEIVDEIRSGLEDDDVMRRHDIPLRVFQRILQALVSEDVITHEELYSKSVVYRSLIDILRARDHPRVYVPISIRVRCIGSSRTGFLLDISESGLRVAGLQEDVGDEITLRLPLDEVSGSLPVEFQAICRWSVDASSGRKHPVSGFQIKSISQKARKQILGLVRFCSSRSTKPYDPFVSPENFMTTQASEIRLGCRRFSGTVHEIDLLDFIQFLVVSCASSLMEIESPEGETCILYLNEGNVVHAIHGAVEGPEAFFSAMGMQTGRFSTGPWREPERRTIDEPGEYLVFEAARRLDESYVQVPERIFGAKLSRTPSAATTVNDSTEATDNSRISVPERGSSGSNGASSSDPAHKELKLV